MPTQRFVTAIARPISPNGGWLQEKEAELLVGHPARAGSNPLTCQSGFAPAAHSANSTLTTAWGQLWRERRPAVKRTRGVFMRPFALPPAPAVFDLDMAKIEDEPLVVLAQAGGYSPAHGELLRRCQAETVRLISRLAARTSLQDADFQDAEQEAVLWSLEAIRKYRKGCRFRSFLHRVLTA
jgi:Sigma-70 region 2